MENLLRAALLEWLRAGPAVGPSLNAVEEESPLRASPPWLGIAASASTDWSTKGRAGREIRVALQLQTRGDDPGADAGLITAIERRVSALPAAHTGFHLASVQFLRARAERRDRGLRSFLLEYRFRILENQSE